MNLFFFTSNESKVQWANDLAKAHKLDIKFVQKKIQFNEGRELDVANIAKNKIAEASSSNKEPFIVEDSGFYIQKLGGFPATHVNFMIQTIGINGLLKLLKDYSGEERNLIARSAIGYFDGKESHIFIGEDVGRIAEEPRGKTDKGWGEFMRILMPIDKNKTFSEFTETEWYDYTRGPKRQDALARSLDQLLNFLGRKDIKPSK